MKKTDKLQALYLEKKLEESQNFLSLFYFVGTGLYLGFWVADYIQYFEHRFEFLKIRIAFCLVAFLSFLHTRYHKSYLSNQLWQLIFALIGSSGITYMMMRTDGPESIYYSGLNLVAALSLLFATYQTGFFLMALVATYLPYFLLCYYQQNRMGISSFLIHSFFIFGTIFVIVFARTRKEKGLIELLTTQMKLEDVITNREMVIEQKTMEATKLNQLSSQFSPQIVAAIREGKIDLQEAVHRSNICAIFIDIVNSTERVVRLDHDKVQKVLARFLDTTLTIFLKYDLTIDKFQGDGVLAFSNDPVKREDFVERVCLAAIEVRSAIMIDQLFYISNWESELKVRIGISVGSANVGFYGDKKYFRSFTAIGIPLPFASRLAAIADPNQILIDSKIAEILLSQNYIVTKVGEKILKGFENETNVVYDLVDSPIAKQKFSELKTCLRHPDSVMYLETNEKSHFEFVCRECNFEAGSLQQFPRNVGINKV